MTASPEEFYAMSPDEQCAALAHLAETALTRWPGEFSGLEPIKFRENAVFAATRQDGRRFALRIHRHAYHSPDALLSELAWMRALSEAGIGAPPVEPNDEGEYLTEVSHPAVPEARQIDLLEWLPGVPVGSAEVGVAQEGEEVVLLFEKVGATAARIHNHSANWVGSNASRRHSWDAEGLIGSNPLWGRFWEMPGLSRAQVALLQAAREKASGEIAAFGTDADRYGLIHADFVPENLLYDGRNINLIDFDDCGFGWHMFELATALYFTVHQPNHDELSAALFRGYRTLRGLPKEHEDLLPLFLFLRGTTYLGWIQTRAETQTAKEMASIMIERVTLLAERYLTPA